MGNSTSSKMASAKTCGKSNESESSECVRSSQASTDKDSSSPLLIKTGFAVIAEDMIRWLCLEQRRHCPIEVRRNKFKQKNYKVKTSFGGIAKSMLNYSGLWPARDLKLHRHYNMYNWRTILGHVSQFWRVFCGLLQIQTMFVDCCNQTTIDGWEGHSGLCNP